MFHDLIVQFIPFIEDLIDTILSNDLLAYVFYLGLFGFIVHILRMIMSLNNSDFGHDTSYNKSLGKGGKK